MDVKRVILAIAAITIVGLSVFVAYWHHASIVPEPPHSKLTGVIEIDGSSTVYLIALVAAEEFMEANPGVKVIVGISGTGGGFKRFVKGEIDIVDASRPIKPSEAEAARENNIEYIEFKIAIDGIAVVVNPNNWWVDYMTVQELNMTWMAGSIVDSWDDIRPGWPNQPIVLFGPGADSGTFDYFTEVIIGRRAVRLYHASEDDYILVHGVAETPNALGYFGYAYYAANKDKLKIVPIDSGEGPVTPTYETIIAGKYRPLSRPLFMYVNKAALKRPEVRAFLEFLMENAEWLVTEAGYIPLPPQVYQDNLAVLRGQG